MAAELAALREKQAALERTVAAERQRALRAEADKLVAEAKMSQLVEKGNFMQEQVSTWRASNEVERSNLFKHLELQSKQVGDLVAANNERTVIHL